MYCCSGYILAFGFLKNKESSILEFFIFASILLKCNSKYGKPKNYHHC
jgi:hypothetical protein